MRRDLLSGAAAALLLLAAACGGEKPSSPANPPANAKRVDAATAATVAGRITFEGTVPENPPVKISGDPMCQKAHAEGLRLEHYVVRDGGLDNVFVRVKDSLADYAFDPPAAPATLDQQGCRYVPHVLGVRVGQPIEISNSDATTHNVHSQPDVNREFNFAQFQQGQKNVQTFTAPEVMVPFKCDLHGWMNAYIGVMEHPFFAVSADGGRFELKGLPPGTYTLEAWHEKAGTRTQQITVGPGDSKTVGFVFKADSAN